MTDYSTLRKALLAECNTLLLDKKNSMKESLHSLQDALENESKSSAGDKYETGTEMIQIEKQKIQTQLGVLDASFKLLHAAATSITKDTIQNGTLVITNTAKYLIGPSLGKVQIGEEAIFVISPSSPIAQAFLHKKVGEVVSFNGQEIEVLGIG